MRLSWALVPVVVLVLAASSAVLFAWPPISRTAGADAVVVFGGDHGERLGEALRLVHAGRAPVLVLAEEPIGVSSERAGLPPGVRLMRISPQGNTRGEARAFAALARDQHWKSLLMVTSTYHAPRAHLLFENCFAGRLHAAPGRSVVAVSTQLRLAGHELLGLARALADRGC